MHAPGKVLVGAVVLGAGAILGSSAGGAAPSTPASKVPVTISAASVHVGELTYAGVVDVTTATGTVPALELSLDTAAFTDLALALPCVPIQLGGLTGGTTTTGVTSVGRMVVYATYFASGPESDRVQFSTEAPPPQPGVLASDTTLVAPEMVALLATAPGLRLPMLTSTTTFCDPGAVRPLPNLPLAPGPASTAATDDAPPPTPTPTSTPSSTPPAEPDGTGEPSATPTDTATAAPTPEPIDSPSPTDPPPPTASAPEPSPTP
jgi:hypothetical protein